jgi:nucleoid-associated protein YgaU
MVGGGFLAATLFCGSASYAQSLGDIARQERERRKQETHHSIYVYTNEDLKRESILIPEDRERVLADRQNEAPPEIQVLNADAPALPVPNPVPFLPIAPSEALVLAEELRVAAESLSPRPVRVVVKTTPVVHATPKIHAQIVPNIPSRHALLAPATPHKAVQHQETEQAVTLAHFEKKTSHVAPSSPSAHVLVAVSAPHRSVQHNETLQATTLDQSESKALRAAPSSPAAQTFRAVSTPEQSVQHRQARPAVTLAHFDTETPHVAPSVPNQEQTDSANVSSVRIERGDSLWRLAKRHLGNGSRWRELAELNPEISNPGFIRVGDQIRLPNA